MKIVKDLEISTGHRLHLYKGGCANLHGHNYHVMISIDFAEVKSDLFIPDIGFYIDFKDIKNIINENFDHKFLIYKRDPYLQQLENLPGIRIVTFAPTAENIAKEIVEKVGEILCNKVKPKQISSFGINIKLNETSTAYVEYSKSFELIK